MTAESAKGPHTAITQAPPALVDIVGPVDIDRLADVFKKFEDFKNRLLSAEDAVTIQNRRVVKRSGWAKWRLACNVSDRILEQKRTPEIGVDADGHFSWRVVSEAYHTATQRASTGVAIASSSEKKNWTHPEHDIYTLAATRSKNRATSDLIGGGELSAEELDAEPPKQSTVTSTVTSPAKSPIPTPTISSGKPASKQPTQSWTDNTA